MNKDGTLNSPGNPAGAGDLITICATGVGSMTFNNGYAVTNSTVNVFVGGYYALGSAAVLGPVAGLPGDVYQISVYVPAGANQQSVVLPPQVAVTLIVNGFTSQTGLAVAVKD